MTSTTTADAPIPTSPGGDWFGQPKGLWVLAGTELWDRISFHGMQAMLVLYMTGDLLIHPQRVASIIGFGGYRHLVEGMTGPLTDVALATQTFGFYLAFVTGLPLLGGWLGDKFLGRKLSVGLGAALMTAGHFFMAFDATFLFALLFLMTGAGMLRGNLSPQIKSLYADGDPRETNAFQYYYFAVNFGAFIAPIVSGAVAAVWGWHWGFGVAGFGMLIGLVVYLSGARHLPADGTRRAAKDAPAAPREALTGSQKRRIWGLALLFPISVLFWTAQSQIWNVYNVWVRDHIDMNVGSFAVPVPWLQSLDGLAPAIFTPITLWIWASMARKGREPDEFQKLALGLLLLRSCRGDAGQRAFVRRHRRARADPAAGDVPCGFELRRGVVRAGDAGAVRHARARQLARDAGGGQFPRGVGRQFDKRPDGQPLRADDAEQPSGCSTPRSALSPRC